MIYVDADTVDILMQMVLLLKDTNKEHHIYSTMFEVTNSDSDDDLNVEIIIIVVIACVLLFSCVAAFCIYQTKKSQKRDTLETETAADSAMTSQAQTYQQNIVQKQPNIPQ